MRMNTGKKLFLCAGLLAFFLSVSAQSYSLRTNVIGLATTNLNLEASMTLNRKWSLHLPVQYNPFKFGRNRQFRNFYAAPGVRYWLLESYMGGFIGMYGTAGTYSVGNLFGNKYRYEGEGYGVGLSIGKAYQIGRRWVLWGLENLSHLQNILGLLHQLVITFWRKHADAVNCGMIMDIRLSMLMLIYRLYSCYRKML